MHEMLIIYDDVFRLHDDPTGAHMESPQRLSRVIRALNTTKLYTLVNHRSPRLSPWTEERLCEIHSCEYVARIRELSEKGGGLVDPDTYANEYTFQAATRYAEAVLDGANELAEGKYRIVFVPGRPPGHHAGRYGVAMGAPTLGFCIFNVSALAAVHLARLSRPRKVLVIDFDLHHGNGTQEILYDNPDIIHLDLHQDPSTIYPGTGWSWQIGEGIAKGTKINILVPPGAGDDVYIALFDKALDLVLNIYGYPEYVVVDAGFDAYRDDGLGLLNLSTITYYHMGKTLRKLGAKYLVVFEGGYLGGLERALPAFLAGLLGLQNPYSEDSTKSSNSIWKQALENFEETRENVEKALRDQLPP